MVLAHGCVQNLSEDGEMRRLRLSPVITASLLGCLHWGLLMCAAPGARGSNIRIEWIDAADGSGLSHPQLVGLEASLEAAAATKDLPPQKGGETAGAAARKARDHKARDQKGGREVDAEQDYELAWLDGFSKTNKHTWFAASRAVRMTRPPSITHPVGTVYSHSKTGALGVVIGWDVNTVAPRQVIFVCAFCLCVLVV